MDYQAFDIGDWGKARKTCQISRSLGRILNSLSPEYEAGVLLCQPQHHLCCHWNQLSLASLILMSKRLWCGYKETDAHRSLMTSSVPVNLSAFHSSFWRVIWLLSFISPLFASSEHFLRLLHCCTCVIPFHLYVQGLSHRPVSFISSHTRYWWKWK